jgi:hypothetical protein
MTMRHSIVPPVIALLIGAGIGYVDSRPAWDDAGITAGMVFLTAAVLAGVRPRTFWVSGLAAGLPVFVMNAILHSNFGSGLAVGVGLIGSVVGLLVGRVLRHGDSQPAGA